MGSHSPQAAALSSPPPAENTRGAANNFARPGLSWEGSSWRAAVSPGLSSPLTLEPQWENYSHTGKQSEIGARLCSLTLGALSVGIVLLSLFKLCCLSQQAGGEGKSGGCPCPVMRALG